ncbi:hypothetical protein FGO68_gene226 [Halteria grandinella]|uniref:Uncharacterized protein n=1 Tax=Halteria grandinella TaxID=5974 RepID=A0A8J8NPJ4_HALGN|nr:hypothetical protein FGO68_gene226 [Halteria grandinella]
MSLRLFELNYFIYYNSEIKISQIYNNSYIIKCQLICWQFVCLFCHTFYNCLFSRFFSILQLALIFKQPTFSFLELIHTQPLIICSNILIFQTNCELNIFDSPHLQFIDHPHINQIQTFKRHVGLTMEAPIGHYKLNYIYIYIYQYLD